MTNKPMLSVERDLIESSLECLERCQEQAFQSCECETCLECGKMPDECTGTECAKTCGCSTCAHCCNELAIKELRALLDKPAAQHQGEPVELQHMAVSEGGVLRWMTGRKMQDCELYAMPDGSAIRSKLYAEQPAPVAVVMPGRRAIHTAWDHAYNAALAEVARLNGVKP